MLKRNLIVIAIAAIGLVFASNAFGQEQRRKSAPKTAIKKPASTQLQGRKPSSLVNNENIKEVELQRTRRPKRNVSQKTKITRPQNISEAGGILDWYQGVKQPSGKKPRTRSTQKRQHKPIQ